MRGTCQADQKLGPRPVGGEMPVMLRIDGVVLMAIGSESEETQGIVLEKGKEQ